MFDLKKCILVTNNDRAAAKWTGDVKQVVMRETYEEVLKTARDFIHTGHRLLTHPQASSLKPNQTPYRTILLYGEREALRMEDLDRIEQAIEGFKKWNDIKSIPAYDEKTAYDYKTIDLSMIENIIPRL